MREFKDSISGESSHVLSQGVQQPQTPVQPVAGQTPMASPAPIATPAPSQPAQAPVDPTPQP